MQRVLRKTYNGEQLILVERFKYLGLELHRLNDMKRVIEELCKQAKRAQTVIDLRVSFQDFKYVTPPILYVCQNGICGLLSS